MEDAFETIRKLPGFRDVRLLEAWIGRGRTRSRAGGSSDACDLSLALG